MASSKQLVEVIQLGRKSYASALKVQHHYARRHLDALEQSSLPPHALLIVEHPPVYTVGRRSQDYTEQDEQKLRALGADYHVTNRGGLITFHGPGQLVAYPILNLKLLALGMRHYICALQKTVIATCGKYGLKGETTENTGVWVRDRKICAMGVHGRRHITTHGLALNVDMDLSWFDHITPCGLEGKQVTSLAKETETDLTLQDVLPHFLTAFKTQFNVDLINGNPINTENIGR